MSGWEIFTWFSVAVLGIGAPIVLVFFFYDLKDLLSKIG